MNFIYFNLKLLCMPSIYTIGYCFFLQVSFIPSLSQLSPFSICANARFSVIAIMQIPLWKISGSALRSFDFFFFFAVVVQDILINAMGFSSVVTGHKV